MENLKEREEGFKKDVFDFKNYFPETMLTDFFNYWSEANRNGKKMRFEMEKTWDLNRRLQRWSNNQKNWNNGTHKQTNTADAKLGTSAARMQALRNW